MSKFKKYLFLTVCIPVLFSFRFFAGSIDELIVKLEDYLAYYTPEKVYVHHDKPYYSAGDTIWFSTYLAHGISHMATAPSKLVYVELVNGGGEVLSRRDIFITEGTGAGDIALPDSLASGTYLLRAYTSFMRNFDQEQFFSRQLTIENLADPSQNYDAPIEADNLAPDRSVGSFSDMVRLQFFPESGDLINGLWSTVALKATGPDGKGTEVKGEVTDSKGDKVADIATGRFGMGKFLIQPVEGESYFAILQFGLEKMKVPLPQAMPSGFVMTLTNVSPKFITFKVEGSGVSTDGGTLIGHVRGVVFLTLEATKGQPLQGLIPKENLPEGVASFTFFDDQGRPRVERVVFIDQSAKRPVATVSGLQGTYAKRSKVALGIDVETDGQALSANLSVTVVDKAKAQFAPYGENIVSYLLMTSDLRGEIEEPGYYFDGANKDRAAVLDNLMMTQGWRRFTWTDIIEDKKPDINHLVEPGFSLAGRVTDFFSEKRPVQATVKLTATEADGDLWTTETETDQDGYFLFTALDIDDTAKIVLQTPDLKKADRKGSRKDFVEGGGANLSTKITLAPDTSPEVPDLPTVAQKAQSARAIAAYLEEARKMREIEAAFAGQDVVILDELEVESGRILTGERFNRPGMVYDRPTRRLDVDSLTRTSQYMSIFEVFLSNTPGVRVVGSYPQYNLIIRNAVRLEGVIHPLYLLNGSIVDVSMINSLPVNRVDFVDILTGTGATMYGTQGAGGVVAVYLKDGDEVDPNYVPKGSLGLTHPGFYHAREFYSPDYSTKKESHARTDIRPTLFWKGGLKAGEGAPAQLEFYTSDVASTFEVRIEGITEDGRPFVKTEEFVVN